MLRRFAQPVFWLILTTLPAWSADRPARQPAKDTAAMKQRVEGAGPAELPRLAEELRKNPGSTASPLMGVLATCHDERMVDPWLQSMDMAQGCSLYGKTLKLLMEVRGLPFEIISQDPGDPETIAYNYDTWNAWWNGQKNSPAPWTANTEKNARDALAAKDPPTRARGLVALAALRIKDAGHWIETLIASVDAVEQVAAYQAIGLLGDPVFRKRLAAGLAGKTPKVAEAAAVAVRHLDDASQAPALRVLAQGADLPAKRAALKALVALGDADTLSGLAKDLLSETAETRAMALSGLSIAPSKKLKEILSDAANQAQGSSLLDLAAALALMGEPKHLPALIEALKHQNRAVRLTAGRLLLQVGGPKERKAVATAMDALVSDAISAGVEALNQPPLNANQSGFGPMALRAYTLAKCKVPLAEIKDTVDLVAEGPKPEDGSWTYGTALALMTLEAEGGHAYLDKVETLAKSLVDAQHDDGTWGYRPPPAYGKKPAPGFDPTWYDHSNTQFALLGLRAVAEVLKHAEKEQDPYERQKAAGRTGKKPYRIPKDVWQKSWNHFIGAQNKDGSYSGGWSYQKGGGSYGSMTCSGICSLIICHYYLHEGDKHLNFTALPPIGKGLGWLDDNFTVTTNPGAGSWLYYYLYSIERVGMLSGEKDLGGEDWYKTGAAFLLKAQDLKGSWNNGDLNDTCFALLFLGRATKGIYYDVGESK